VIQGVCEKMKALQHKPKPIRGFDYQPTLGYTPPANRIGTDAIKENQISRVTEMLE